MSTHEPASLSSLFDDPISRLLRTLLDEYEAGARLPNERDLALEFGVSRTALRDRMRLLESVGLVSRRQGAGTFVEKTYNAEGLAFALDLLVTTGQMSIGELHQVRVGLERQAAIVAASRPAAPEHVAELRAALEEMDAQYGRPEVLAADVAFHHGLMRASENRALAFFSDALQGILARDIAFSSSDWQRVGRKVLLAAHEGIVDAIVAGDPRAAAMAVDDLFALHLRDLNPR